MNATLTAQSPGRSRPTESAALPRLTVDGKFLGAGPGRFYLKGVTYGTFAPDSSGYQFPSLATVTADFHQMAEAGFNTVRVYTPPRRELLDAAALCGLRVIVGVPWTQHVAFLDDRSLAAKVRKDVSEAVARLADHPAVAMFALGNEIPPAIVRWHGREGVEAFLADLLAGARDVAPEALFTYVNFPPTEFLDVSAFDVMAVNVYLHRQTDLRAYLARLQNLAGHKPLLLAEAGADSLREGLDGQAAITAMHVRAAFEEGLCGAVAYAWTDEWWRGGQDVTDWKFGLVDADRQPKPALTAVSQAFADAPFAEDSRATWPRVSVVVCAYNAADTIADCLTSLSRLDYPDFEVIVVNDGSKDATGEISRGYPVARVVDIPNGGLSAARNVGLLEATGEIVAYTDADTRVDQDWLAHLVQPFLYSDVVASGGPNVVPADDPFIAQAVARAPGGPTQVLLDDRIAEHVPGCNMAFRREALQAIGGFNAIFLRAGDDVDACWRLQANGGKIGFAAAAFVWHHHRASVKAYWRQQVGYGEGETWLRHQHPDKFAGSSMIWHGRIYSPLPFVRALTRMRLNTGTWGLSPFPSVYHTGAQPMAYLPHSAAWHVLSAVALVAGFALLLWTGQPAAALPLVLLGAAGIATTVSRCIEYARKSDLRGVAPIGRLPMRLSRSFLRLAIAWLHLLQPLARLRGRVRGWMSPPPLPAVEPGIPASLSRPVPGVRDGWAALRLMAGASAEQSFWNERWLAVDDLLTRLLRALRISRLSSRIDIDDGWNGGRDLSLALGRWAWVDLDALIEEHAMGRVLVRVRTSMRPTASTVVVALGAFAIILAASTNLLFMRWPYATVAALTIGVLALSAGVWRTASMFAAVRGVIAHAMRATGATPLERERPRLRFVTDHVVWGHLGRSALASLFVVGLALGGGSLLREGYQTVQQLQPRLATPVAVATHAPTYRAPRLGLAVAPNGDLYLADGAGDRIRRVNVRGVVTTIGGPSPAVAAGARREPTASDAPGFDAPGGVAVAGNGDLFIADSENHRVYRIDRLTRATIVVAGSGRAEFSGDGGPATRAGLNMPTAVAVDGKGDVYVADSGNHRIRRVTRKTGLITTVAGSGAAEDDNIGDGKPATAAQLFWPSDIAIAPNGDLFVADTGHNRVRKIDAVNGNMTTIAGNGTAGLLGDGGPATAASLSSPTGLAVVASNRSRLTIYIADSANGRVRVVSADGTISSLAGANAPVFGTPARLAFHPRGWLYVADATEDQVTAVSIPEGGPSTAATPPATAAPALPSSLRRQPIGRRVM